VALRWQGLERAVAVGLYVFRLVGFAVFEVTGERAVLLLFPNVFELWFLVMVAIHRLRPGTVLPPVATALVLAGLVVVKELQEWALHGARLFDGISSLEFLDQVRRWLTGET
jgi:hypothetical protein